jgi:hypothetical protein
MSKKSFDQLALEADFEGLPRGKYREPADTWSAELVRPLEVQVVMVSAKDTKEKFLARLLWSRYPDNPPSVLFLDPKTGASNVAQAWPTGGPFRPPTGLCINFTAEGFALHPEWTRDPLRRWLSQGNVLLRVIRQLQERLDLDYAGRQT